MAWPPARLIISSLLLTYSLPLTSPSTTFFGRALAFRCSSRGIARRQSHDRSADSHHILRAKVLILFPRDNVMIIDEGMAAEAAAKSGFLPQLSSYRLRHCGARFSHNTLPLAP